MYKPFDNRDNDFGQNIAEPPRSSPQSRVPSEDASLRADHPDAIKARIAPAEVSGEYAQHVAGSDPRELERHSPSAFASSNALHGLDEKKDDGNNDND